MSVMCANAHKCIHLPFVSNIGKGGGVFYYLIVSEIWPVKRAGGSSLIGWGLVSHI